MTRAQHDARAESNRRAAEAAGIPIRDDADFRTAVDLDLRGAHGPHWIIKPVPRKIAWIAYDADTLKPEARGSIKQLVHAAADRMVRMRSPSALY